MALLPPISSGTLTQGFGHSGLSIEPAMYRLGSTKAWWQPFSGASFDADCHAAIDIGAPEGTRISASEAGTVIESHYDSSNGGGHKVRVQIRTGVSYCSNHMASRAVAVGAHVTRGQKLGTVGHTGWATGNHDHFQVGIVEGATSQTWPMLYNPALFLTGGKMVNDPRIQPLEVRHLVVNGPNINIRTSPDLDVGSGNVYATSRADGIYRNGKRISRLDREFAFISNVPTDDGLFRKVVGYQRVLYIYATLTHFVKTRSDP